MASSGLLRTVALLLLPAGGAASLPSAKVASLPGAQGVAAGAASASVTATRPAGTNLAEASSATATGGTCPAGLGARFAENSEACGLESGGQQPVAGQCMARRQGVSPACGACMGDLIHCGFLHCMSPCFNKAGTPQCASCTDLMCSPAFSTCSEVEYHAR